MNFFQCTLLKWDDAGRWLLLVRHMLRGSMEHIPLPAQDQHTARFAKDARLFSQAIDTDVPDIQHDRLLTVAESLARAEETLAAVSVDYTLRPAFLNHLRALLMVCLAFDFRVRAAVLTPSALHTMLGSRAPTRQELMLFWPTKSGNGKTIEHQANDYLGRLQRPCGMFDEPIDDAEEYMLRREWRRHTLEFVTYLTHWWLYQSPMTILHEDTVRTMVGLQPLTPAPQPINRDLPD